MRLCMKDQGKFSSYCDLAVNMRGLMGSMYTRETMLTFNSL